MKQRLRCVFHIMNTRPLSTKPQMYIDKWFNRKHTDAHAQSIEHRAPVQRSFQQFMALCCVHVIDGQLDMNDSILKLFSLNFIGALLQSESLVMILIRTQSSEHFMYDIFKMPSFNRSSSYSNRLKMVSMSKMQLTIT